MVDITSEFVRHEPCTNCGSSDALSVYTDGHTWCFVCHNRTPATDEIVHNHMSKHVHLKGTAGVDAGELNESEVADLFGKTKGFTTTGGDSFLPDTTDDKEEEDF